ncbi:MAG: hypothetical protein KC900_01790 [Candidatus Omnitrophica bacterium]|nr:hypothetical protein [Candidatus Omnitrophota bacterium]
MSQVQSLSGRRWIIATAFLLLIGLCSAVSAEPKAWETERETMRTYGQIQVRMQKNFERDAEPNAFQVSAAKMQSPVTTVFRGVCSELATLKVSIGDQRVVDVKRHIESGKGADLPIGDFLDASVKALSEQCPQLQVVRVEATPVYPHQGKFDYKGTMRRANNWRLEDGLVKTAYDGLHTFEIKFRDMMSTLGVNFKGGCEEDTIIELSPMYANRQEATFADPPDITDYVMMAKGVSQRYAKECPEVTALRFSINPVPEEYECVDTENCFLKTAKEQDWEVDRTALAYKAPEEDPIPDLAAMARVLAEENYGLLKDYQNLFAFFYENFLELYSTHCRSYIRNPKILQLQTVEVTTDGFFSNAEPVGPPRTLYLDPEYVESWEWFYQSWKPWAVNRYMTIVMNNQKRGRGPAESVRWAMGHFTRHINSLENVIRGNCTDETVQAAYRNMRKYAYMKDKPMNTRTKQMTEEFRSMVDMVSEGIGLVQDAYSGNPSEMTPENAGESSQTGSKKPDAEQTAPVAGKTAEPTGATAGMVGAWSAQIDGKQLELALWPQPGKPEWLEGYAYVPAHDCLMQAAAYPYEEKIAFNFNSSGAANREGNCQKDLGSMQNRFQADGWLNAESDNLLKADLPFLIMGKPVRVSGEGESPRASFKRGPASADFKNILGTFEHPYREEPRKDFIDSI